MHGIDATFEALKRMPFDDLHEILFGVLIVNPMTFEVECHKFHHHIITGAGRWMISMPN